MAKQFLQKAGMVALTFVGITFLSFLLIHLAPSDPAEITLSRSGAAYSEEQLWNAREELGLNDPLLVQYAKWVGGLFRGDLGTSMHNRKPVGAELAAALPNTLLLSVSAFFTSLVISLGLGLVCAMRPGGPADRIIMAVCNLMAALPGYFISLMLLYFFALRLNLLPVLIQEINLKAIIMPVVALSIGLIAPGVRQIRAVMTNETQKYYVLGIRSKGVRESRVFMVHILRNCLPVLLSMAGVSLGALLGGSVIVETIFGWPGLGKLAVEAITHRDYPMLQGYIVFMATAYFIINFSIDAVQRWLDPRPKHVEAVYD